MSSFVLLVIIILDYSLHLSFSLFPSNLHQNKSNSSHFHRHWMFNGNERTMKRKRQQRQYLMWKWLNRKMHKEIVTTASEKQERKKENCLLTAIFPLYFTFYKTIPTITEICSDFKIIQLSFLKINLFLFLLKSLKL